MEREIDLFLSRSPIARRSRVAARVVFRRARIAPRELHEGFVAGAVRLAGDPVCELVVGGQVIARGEVTEKDGNYYFKAREAAS